MTNSNEYPKSESPDDNWRCDGWNEPARDHVRAARAMTLRERLIWLENATKTARILKNAPAVEPPAYARRRPLAAAEDPATYQTKPPASEDKKT